MKVGELKKLNQMDVSKHYSVIENYIKNNAGNLSINESVALTIAKSVLAKQLPMTPAVSPSGELYQCPICHRVLTNIRSRKATYQYCPKCGQRIYWGE